MNASGTENDEDPARALTPRWIIWGVALLLVLGLGLRVMYASYGLHRGRFWDERYSQLNVHSLLEGKTFRPANAYYPSPFFNLPAAVVVATSQKIYEATGNESYLAVEEGKFKKAGYLSGRMVQVLFGVLGIWLVFWVGRRLFSPEVGLVAALALAFMPWHIHASGIFKPDAQLVAMVLLAFYLALRAVERPNLPTYLLAGVGIALAMSSKMTGGVIALALVAGTLAAGWRDWRRWVLLCAAGVMSAGTFMAMNPWWSAYPYFLRGLQRDYAIRAELLGWSRWDIPGRVIGLLTEPYVLGPLLGSLGLISFCLIIVRLLTPGWKPARHHGMMMLVVFPIAYVLSYAVKTAYFKSNNFLPVVPFICLAMAWSLVAAWRSVTKRVQRPGLRFGLRLALVAASLALLVPGGPAYVYRSLVPTTLDVALKKLGTAMRRGRAGRVVAVEKMPATEPSWEGAKPFLQGQAAVLVVDSIGDLTERRIARTDGLIFRASRLGKEDDLYERLSESRYVSRFSSKFLSARGPTLVAVMNRFRRLGAGVELEIQRCRSSNPCVEAGIQSRVARGDLVSLTVRMPAESTLEDDGRVVLRYGNREVDMLGISIHRGVARYVTPRFRVKHPMARLRLESDRRMSRRKPVRMELYRWERRWR